MTVTQILKDWRRAKINVGARPRWAIEMVRVDASKVENIVGSFLLQPEAFPGGQVESDNCVRALGRGIHVCVTRSDIENAALCVNGGCVPDSCAGGTEFRVAGAGLGRPGLFRYRVGPPDLFAGQCVDRDNISAKCAAGIVGIAAVQFLI